MKELLLQQFVWLFFLNFLSSAILFKRYEKDRRSRFNALLDKLASLLPNFQEANDSDQKWTKAQIVEFAIKHIRSFQQQAQTIVGS